MTKIENITLTNTSKHERELLITLPIALVNKEYDQTVNNIQKVASRPGFRPGKMPRNMVLSLYGAEIKRTLLKNLMENTFPDALQDKALVAVSDPRFEPQGECQREKAFSYKAFFQVKPTIEIKSYEGLAIDVKNFVVPPEAVDNELEHVRESYATLVSPEDRDTVGPEDIAYCRAEIFYDGELSDEQSTDNYVMPLFNKEAPSIVREALLGKKVGETVKVNHTVPEDVYEENLRGKKCEMILEIKEIKQRILPNLDDDFAKDLSDKYTCLDDLKEAVSTRLNITARRRNDYYKQDAIMRALLEHNPFEVPPALIERMAFHLINRELESLPKDVAEDAIKNRWQMMWESVQEHANYRVKSQLLLEALIEKLDIEVSDEEVNSFLRNGKKDIDKNDAIYSIKVEKLLNIVEKSSVINIQEQPLFG